MATFSQLSAISSTRRIFISLFFILCYHTITFWVYNDTSLNEHNYQPFSCSCTLRACHSFYLFVFIFFIIFRYKDTSQYSDDWIPMYFNHRESIRIMAFRTILSIITAWWKGWNECLHRIIIIILCWTGLNLFWIFIKEILINFIGIDEKEIVTIFPFLWVFEPVEVLKERKLYGYGMVLDHKQFKFR